MRCCFPGARAPHPEKIVISTDYLDRACSPGAAWPWHGGCIRGVMPSADHITVAYDGSPLSELSLRRALSMATGSKVARVHVVCVAQTSGSRLRLPTGPVLTRAAAQLWLEQIISRAARDTTRQGRSPAVIAHLTAGDPARVIVDIAYRYHTELILMGAGGQGGHHPIGSVTQAVLDLSEIPVDLQTPLAHSVLTQRFNPLRFAYVLGGPALRQEVLGSAGGVGAALA